MRKARTVIAGLSIAVVLAGGLKAANSDKAAESSYEKIVARKRAEALEYLQKHPWPSPEAGAKWGPGTALLLLYNNADVERAEALILRFCRDCPAESEQRPELLLRIALLQPTRQRLSPKALAAIEDYAWDVVTNPQRGFTLEDADENVWTHGGGNHPLNRRRNLLLALRIVGLSERYGCDAVVDGETVQSHYRAWIAHWQRRPRARAMEGVDTEINTKSSYNTCNLGVHYDLYELSGSATLRELAENYLTLYWAEFAGEYEPRTGTRAVAGVRKSAPWNIYNSLSGVLSVYNWDDRPFRERYIGNGLFLTSSYQPPEIVSAIARDRNRGEYLATSRRAGVKTEDHVFLDENGDGHVRRDVYYTPDYTLSTLAYDPSREYEPVVILAQLMGVTFAGGQHVPHHVDCITVQGTGYYGKRAVTGITGKGVSVIARDPKAAEGTKRFQSTGTRVFIRKGRLWDNRVEDPSGWFFTRLGDAYVAIRQADAVDGYTVNEKAFEPNKGYGLEFEDKWAPVIIQMGRAKVYESFATFQASVKDNPLSYEPLPEKEGAGKMTYVSEAGERFEYWANSKKLPNINGRALNLNPRKTYDSPFLSMVHGEQTATIRYPGYEDVLLDFAPR